MKPRKITAIIALTLVMAFLALGARSYAASSPAKVSLDLKFAELAEVFRVLANVSGANIVVSPSVSGKVTVKLVSVPVEEALDIICAVSDLEYIYLNGTIMVGPKGSVSTLMDKAVVEKLELINIAPSDAASKLTFAVPGIAAQPDDKAGTLLLRGTQSDIALAKAFLAKVDTPVPASKVVLPEQEAIDIIQLANAEAQSVYDAVKGLLSATLAVDARLNSILAGGKVSDVKAARGIIEKLDIVKKAEAIAIQPVEIRVLQLTNAKAADVKPAAALIIAADRIQADASSNSLIIKATPEEHARIAELVKNIDAATPRVAAVAVTQEKLEIVNLLYAKAEDVKKALSVVIPENKIAIDARTNKVMMLLDPAKSMEAMALIKELDVKVAEAPVQVVVAPAMRLGYYSPKFAKATDIESVVKLVAADAKLQVIESNNSLVAYATEAQHAAIAEAVSKLDSEAMVLATTIVTREETRLEIIELKYAQAADVQKALASVLGPDKATIDRRTNKLILKVDPSELVLAQSIISELDVRLDTAPPAAVEAEVLEVADLNYAKASEVKPALEAALGAGKVMADDRSNKLLLMLVPSKKALAMSIISAMDVEIPVEAAVEPVKPNLEMIQLKYAAAADVKKVLDGVLGSNNVNVDERTNKVIMMVTPQGKAMAQGIIDNLDIEVKSAEVAVVQAAPVPGLEVVQIRYASASSVKQALTAVFPAERITVDDRTNKLILKVTPDEKAQAMAIINEVDVKVEAATAAAPVAADTLSIVQLKYAPAAEVGKALEAVIPPQKINVDTRTNKLIMKVGADDIAQVRQIISELDVRLEDQPAQIAEPTQMGFFRIFNVKPSDIEASVKVVAGTAKVQASDITGSITAWGSTSELKLIESLIAKLDIKPEASEEPVEMATAVETLEVVQLMNASAADVKASLSVLLPDSKIAINERTNKLMLIVTPELKMQAMSVVAALDVPVNKAEVLKTEPVKLGFFQMKFASATEMEAPIKLVASSAKVQVAERTNSLIVYGTEAELAIIEQVIEKLDVEIKKEEVAATIAEYRTYKVLNASPTEISSALTILIPASSMVPDDRSGTLIIKADAETQRLAAEVITTLDVKSVKAAGDVVEADVTRVYKLNYAAPADIKAALTEMTTGKIAIDSRTSSVIVTAKESDHAGILDVIEHLDQELSQVFFEASLYELSDDATKRLGIDWTVNKLVFGYNTLSQLATVALDFDNKISALADEGKAKLISKQHTFTVDGKMGRMLIGDRIPVIVQRVEQGQVVNSVEYINAGIELSITPKVSYDGSITAEVKPVISSIVGWTPQNYPQIRTRELETIVNVKNGESAIIGGLFSQEEIETITKVPILGDIPLIKELFTKRGTDVKDQEIIIVITAWTIKPGQKTNLENGVVEIKGPVL